MKFNSINDGGPYYIETVHRFPEQIIYRFQQKITFNVTAPCLLGQPTHLSIPSYFWLMQFTNRANILSLSEQAEKVKMERVIFPKHDNPAFIPISKTKLNR